MAQTSLSADLVDGQRSLVQGIEAVVLGFQPIRGMGFIGVGQLHAGMNSLTVAFKAAIGHSTDQGSTQAGSFLLLGDIWEPPLQWEILNTTV